MTLTWLTSVDIAGVERTWWKDKIYRAFSQYCDFHQVMKVIVLTESPLYFIFSPGSLCFSDVYRRESGTCRTLPFLKIIVSGNVSPFSTQIDWCTVSRVVALVGATDALSGDLYTYFLMRELSGRTSKFIMSSACIYVHFVLFQCFYYFSKNLFIIMIHHYFSY